MSTPQRPPRWQLADAAQGFFERNRHLLSEEDPVNIFPNNFISTPLGRVSILGSDAIKLFAVTSGNDSGYTGVDIELYADGSPYVPEEDFVEGNEDFWYCICAANEVEPFVVSGDALVVGWSGWPGRYISEKLRSKEPVHFLSDDQCRLVMRYLVEVEQLLPKPTL